MPVSIRVKICCPWCGATQESPYALTKDHTLYLQCAKCNKTTVDMTLEKEVY